jgi:monoamine oxidase
MQPRMQRLVASLGLVAYEQQSTGDLLLEHTRARAPQRVRAQAEAMTSFRLRGGIAALVEALAERIPGSRLLRRRLATRVERTEAGARVHFTSEDGTPATLDAKHVVLAMPPRLTATTITFTPELPPALDEAMRSTPTWMAGQAKLVAVYTHPFWREHGLSGGARSAVGPLVEIHDASVPDGLAALFGFVGLTAQQRLLRGPGWAEDAVEQLTRLFGAAAAKPVTVHVKDWAQATATATPADWPPLVEHPNYDAPPGAGASWGERLVWASSETAPRFGGYLEGALEAATHAAALCA